jgi:hypothetical protein
MFDDWTAATERAEQYSGWVMGKAYCQPQREMPASLLSVEHPTQHGHLARTKRTNPARHLDISAEQQQQEKGAPALADRWRRAGCACCCAQIAACVGACEGVRGSRARCILVTQEMSARDSMHTSVIVSRAYLLRSGGWAKGVLPLEGSCPGGCSAIIKHMPPVSRVVEEEEAYKGSGSLGEPQS